MTSRACVMQLLEIEDPTRQSSRRVLGDMRRQLSRYAMMRHRQGLASLLEHNASDRDARERLLEPLTRSLSLNEEAR